MPISTIVKLDINLLVNGILKNKQLAMNETSSKTFVFFGSSVIIANIASPSLTSFKRGGQHTSEIFIANAKRFDLKLINALKRDRIQYHRL